MSGSYVVTVTDANNCSNSNTASVLVNTLPVPTANNNTPICAGATLNLSCNMGITWACSGPGGYASVTQNPSFVVNATPAIGGTYTVNITDINGCAGSATTNVTVNPLPVPIASNNSPICSGATLNFSGMGGPNYGWTGPGGFSSSLQNPSIANTTTLMSGTYTLTIIDPNNCTASVTTQVVINPSPVVTVNSPTICLNNSTTLTANGATTYSWSPSTGLSTSVGNNITANPTSSTTYIVTGVDVNGCVSTANSIVTVNSLPPVAANAATICLGENTGTLKESCASKYVWGPISG